MEAREVVDVWQRLVCPGQQSLQKGPWCCVLLVRSGEGVEEWVCETGSRQRGRSKVGDGLFIRSAPVAMTPTQAL